MPIDDDYIDDVRGWYSEDNPDGAAILDDLRDWFAAYIAVADDNDYDLLALWTVHTHLVEELGTTPRLMLDSIRHGSGKTTLLEHLGKLCANTQEAALITSEALVARLLADGAKTLLLDEIDRTLAPERPATPALLAAVNSGYRVGATRPTLVPVKGGGWEPVDLRIYGPVALAGNSPRLPADTRSRALRVLLLPDDAPPGPDDDLDPPSGRRVDTEWEFIEQDALALHDRVAAWADTVRDMAAGLEVELPRRCVGRSRELWRPLKRVAVLAGGDWPRIANQLIERALDEAEAERADGIRTLSTGEQFLVDLYRAWPSDVGDHDIVSVDTLINNMGAINPAFWGPMSTYGKTLTPQRFGRLSSANARATSTRDNRLGPRGYTRAQFMQAWVALGIAPRPPKPNPETSGSTSAHSGVIGDIGAPATHGCANDADDANVRRCAEAGVDRDGCADDADDANVRRCAETGWVEQELFPTPTGPDENGEPLRCAVCGVNVLVSDRALSTGKCKPCRDKARGEARL